MKNVHLLPTEKPSRLGYLTKKGKEVFKDLRLFDKPMPNILDSENQHIYITSDEEIKVGDWYFITESISKCESKYEANDLTDICKKIILTTDPYLISDGTQAIDDEFLEWFVKNPSCESVETKVVDFEVDMGLGDECIEHGSYYKIILPLGKLTYSESAKKEERIFNSTMMFKQETLEDAAERNCESITHPYCEREKSMFIAGAKWQAERMYSETEVLQLLLRLQQVESYNNLYDWFEQFKKK
jgi:hypothetical protein